MFIPDAILLLCQGLTGFHVGNFLSSSAEEEDSPSTAGESPQKPEGGQDGIVGPFNSSPSTVPVLASEPSASSSVGSTCRTAPETPVMAYPLSDMRNDPHTAHSSSASGFRALGYTSYPTNGDIFMDVAEPSNTSTPVKPKSPSPFPMFSSSAGMDTDSDSDNDSDDSRTIDLDLYSPRSDADTNITTPSTTNGSAFKTPNLHDAMAMKSASVKPRSDYVRKVYPKPAYCAFFSSPHVENTERTRELWKHRLEVARRRAMANSLQTPPPILLRGAAGAARIKARARELRRKAGYIRRMEWIEGITWDLPSEFEQYMFLLKLQAEEEEREKRKEARERREGGYSSDEEIEGGYGSESPEPEWGGERYEEEGHIGDPGEQDEGGYLQPPPSLDVADFGRHGEMEEMKMRLEELHRNARAFSVRPLFEEAALFDDDIDPLVYDEGDIVGEPDVDGLPGYI